MKPRRNFNAPSIVLASVSLGLVLLFAAPTPALALGDWIGVEGALWRQSQDGNASIDGSASPGTTIDFQDTLGLDQNDDTLMGRVWFRWSRTRLVFDYFDSSRSGSSTLAQSFVFNDTIYTAGQNLNSDMDIELLQGHFLVSVVDAKVVDFGLGLGANQATIKMEIDNGLPGGRSTLDEKVPYPSLATYVTIKPFPTFHIRAELNGMRGTVSGTHVDITDARLQIEWYVAHVFGLFAGYRQYRFDVDDEGFGSVENTFKGPYAGIGLRF